LSQRNVKRNYVKIRIKIRRNPSTLTMLQKSLTHVKRMRLGVVFVPHMTQVIDLKRASPLNRPRSSQTASCVTTMTSLVIVRKTIDLRKRSQLH
jgi:hypothetical protein